MARQISPEREERMEQFRQALIDLASSAAGQSLIRFRLMA